jgi:Amino acid permease
VYRKRYSVRWRFHFRRAIFGRRFACEVPGWQRQNSSVLSASATLSCFTFSRGLSLRWIATAAATGPSAIFVWLTALCGFFLPLPACVLDLSSRYPAEGGLYIGTLEAFGPFPAFMSAWIYWMSNLPYFPAILFFAASSPSLFRRACEKAGRLSAILPGFYRRDDRADYPAECSGPEYRQVAQQSRSHRGA